MEINTEPTCREMGGKGLGQGGELQPEAKLEGEEVFSKLLTQVACANHLI